jgi:hypothetical protein
LLSVCLCLVVGWLIGWLVGSMTSSLKCYIQKFIIITIVVVVVAVVINCCSCELSKLIRPTVFTREIFPKFHFWHVQMACACKQIHCISYILFIGFSRNDGCETKFNSCLFISCCFLFLHHVFHRIYSLLSIGFGFVSIG